jgi:hypothetical protein
MRQVSALIVLAFLVICSSMLVFAADWQVRRNNMSGTCSLQPSDSHPPMGKLLSTKPTKREACQDAKMFKTDDASDTDKCFTYTPNTVTLCHAEGIELVP